MRILHLAYEDPRQPGSGGGSVRTYEINRRLAAQHQITALVAGYPGARPRNEDGIAWVPISTRTGTMLDRLSYLACVGAYSTRYQCDLIVEDFGAPCSIAGSPLFTRTPVVASVQWMFADQMRAKYHLPFDWVERAGLPLYHRAIAVSSWLADELQRRNKRITVATIPNGIEPQAFTPAPMAPQHLLFVGRLDTQQKGCDLLLESMALAHRQLGDTLPRLLMVGDGPDRSALEAQAARRGLSQHVVFIGRKDGHEKYALMAESYAVLMPSRFETFGMVAVEAQAAGAPLIAYDVGPLSEVAGPGGARLIAPFDTVQFADAIVELVRYPQHTDTMRVRGREWAKRYNWDTIAAQQASFYEETLQAMPRRTKGR